MLQNANVSNTNEKYLTQLAPDWHRILGPEFQKPYMENLRKFLKAEYQNHQVVYPPKDKIFRSLKLVDYSKVKVVILGQDPYHGPHQANGLAFAVESGVLAPPSLKNIFKEIALEYPDFEAKTDLENWAKQGVLLLNTVLTVRENCAFSHRGQGWELFTNKVIHSLNDMKTPVVFLLWGAAAQTKEAMITSPLHKILKAPHPSPLSSHRGFFGCGHFKKANEFLIENNLTPIQW